MDFNIDELVSKYLEPLKGGPENTEADLHAVEEKQPEQAFFTFTEPEEKEPEPCVKESAAVNEEISAPVQEPEKAVAKIDEPEDLSDFLKDIFESPAVQTREDDSLPGNFKSASPDEPEKLAEDLPEELLKKEIYDSQADDTKLPDLDGKHGYDDDFTTEKNKKPSFFTRIRSHGNKAPHQDDEFEGFGDFPMRKSVPDTDEAPVTETDAPGSTDKVGFTEITENDTEDDGDVKTYTPEETRTAPDYKAFEPEKYSAPVGDFGDLPEERTTVIRDFIKKAPERSVRDDGLNELLKKQQMPSPVTSRSLLADDLLSHLDSVVAETAADQDSGKEETSDFIDRTAIVENLFSKFAKVERDAESEPGKEDNGPAETVGSGASGDTMVFTPDPVPAHMTEPAERAGVEAEKSSVRVFHTGELQPLHEFSGSGTRGRVSITGDFPMKDEIAEPLEGQMSFFEFPEPEPEEQIDEDTIEQDVKYRRIEKVKNFRLVKEFEEMDSESGDLYNHSDDVVADEDLEVEKYPLSIPEYILESDRRKVGWFLLKERRKKNIKTAILAFITFCFALLELLPRMSSHIKGAIGPGTFANSLISFIFVTLAAIVSIDNVVAGMDAIFIRRKLDGRSIGLIALIMTIVQSMVSVFVPKDNRIGLLAGSVAFILLINSITSGMEHERILHNFKFCAYTGKKSLNSVVTVSGEQERREIGQPLAMNEPVIKYSCKVNFPRRFVELSLRNRITDRNGLTLIIITAAIGMLLSILCGIRCGAYYALSGMTAAFCAAIPVAEYFSVTNELRRGCGKLNKAGGMISSLNAARKCSEANAVIIDAAELIDKNGCEMHGMKDFKNVRLDDILLYSAALVIKSDGPLSEVFKGMVMDADDVLPTVSSISFEENLGVSGWIHGQKVLLGNRNLMAAHNIAVPTHREEAMYCVKDRKVLYVAIADKLAAMFVVSYAVDMSKAKYLHCLERNNITVLIDSCDPNVTEEMIEAGFGLEYGSVKIISAIAGRIFRRLKDNFFKKADATVMHDGKSRSFLMGIATSVSLRNSAKVISVAQIVVTVLSLLIMIILAASSRFVFINSWFIAAVNIVSIAVFSLIGRFFRV